MKSVDNSSALEIGLCKYLRRNIRAMSVVVCVAVVFLKVTDAAGQDVMYATQAPPLPASISPLVPGRQLPALPHLDTDDNSFISVLGQSSEELDLTSGDGQILSGLLWKLVSVLGFAVVGCGLLIMKRNPLAKIPSSALPDQASIIATIALSNRGTLNLVNAAGQTLAVVSDGTGVKSVIRLVTSFEDSFDELVGTNEVQHDA